MNANELKAQLNTWVRSMTPRERLMVAAASVLVVVALAWLLLLNPLYSSQEQLAQRVNGKSTLFAELQQRAANRANQPVTRSIQGLDQSIVVVIDRTTRLRGLSPYLKRNQPDGNNIVRLRFENAPFDDLVTWLNEVKVGYGLAATSASIDLAGSPGRINCSVVLERSGG
ncbi:MAG: type II secretion system protein GspM [Gammaproteobacteria bacterium]|nr:type II secretion system protein GspM [Gammaproteobacteria bacterium]